MMSMSDRYNKRFDKKQKTMCKTFCYKICFQFMHDENQSEDVVHAKEVDDEIMTI
jgi:hypothetical protein